MPDPNGHMTASETRNEWLEAEARQRANRNSEEIAGDLTPAERKHIAEARTAAETAGEAHRRAVDAFQVANEGRSAARFETATADLELVTQAAQNALVRLTDLQSHISEARRLRRLAAAR